MRILHVLDHSLPAHSGYAFRTYEIIKAQRQRGWETHHLTSAKHPLPSPPMETVAGLSFHRTPPFGGPLSSLPVANQLTIAVGLAHKLAAVARDVRPDILHAHSPSLTGLAGLWVSRNLDIPLVYEVRALWEDGAVDHGVATEGGLRYRATRGLESFVLRRAHQVTTICEGLRREILARGVISESVSVVPNAVDAAMFSAGIPRDESLASKLGLTKARVIGFIGSFYRYEGLSLLLEALPSIIERDPTVRVLLAGGGPEEEALRSLAQRLRVDSSVVFAGRVPHDQVPAYYSIADVMIYPRLPVRVTELVTPLKPLEAMAQGKLVIASDVGGQKELVRHGQTGLLFEAGDAGALAEVTLAALRDGRGAEIARAARSFVETERTWTKSVAVYESVYARAIAAQRAHGRSG